MAVADVNHVDPTVAPYRAAEGTYMVPEPVIVDTGTLINRDQWQEQVFSLVDPADVRWIFRFHDDPDHTAT